MRPYQNEKIRHLQLADGVSTSFLSQAITEKGNNSVISPISASVTVQEETIFQRPQNY